MSIFSISRSSTLKFIRHHKYHCSAKLTLNMAEIRMHSISFIFILCVLIQSAVPQTRTSIFTETFRQSVYGSPQLTEVFCTSSNSIEASQNFYQTRLDELLKIGAKYPESLSKKIADAVYLTFPLMTTDVFINVTTVPIALYLISKDLLNSDTAASFGVALAGAILKNYPLFDDQPSGLSKNRALSVGLYEFLVSLGIQTADQAPFFVLSSAKTFFAMTSVVEPTVEISAVSPPGVIPDAYQVYGVTAFVTAFAQSVDSSAVLQSVFYLNLPTNLIAKAWNDAFDIYCLNEKCHSRDIGNGLESTILRTYDDMSKSTYVKAIASGYALFLLERGILSSENSAEQAGDVTQRIENLLNNMPGNSDIATRFEAVFESVKDFLGTDTNHENQNSIYFYHIYLSIYAVSSVAMPNDA